MIKLQKFATFGEPVLGYDLYVWAFIVFTCSLFAAAVLLIIFGLSSHKSMEATWGLGEKSAFCLVAAITLANVVITWMDCGFFACQG